ncbi:MAG TPA: sensor histidine kinase [Burkholderiaceae bacterium]|jgi:hypothetical protein|nr:sensor histidine kinase [Burkholderiaceae bacterium]
MSSPPTSQPWRERLENLAGSVRRGLRIYSDWLSRQSWKRLALLSVLALILSGILQDLPPFNMRWGEHTVVAPPVTVKRGHRPHRDYDIRIDEHGVRIGPRTTPVPPPVPGGSAASDAEAEPPEPPEPPDVPEVSVTLPKGADSDEIKQAIEEAKADIEQAIADTKPTVRVVKGFRLGDQLPGIAAFLIVASIIVKIMGSGRRRAEVKAAQATEMAESEALKRQVVEARMAAMQAQVEPHFLFNTLASIDHLIETDPPRASLMQKNLIALLRASMPTMRDSATNLGRELAVIRPYLEILKVRMEDRLETRIDVPEGLMSAEFPPMMLQSLVENAIKHGLEPKPEGGRLTVRAEIVHGKLSVSVIDTGLGFGKAATAGTGVGLANIRERLQMHYGNKAQLRIAANEPSGTAVTIVVPYRSNGAEDAPVSQQT